jgi:WD40 domain-containing protein
MKFTLAHDHKLPTGVLGLAITPDGSRAFASCMDGLIYAVDTASGQAVAFTDSHPSFVSGCALLPDGGTLISAGYDGRLMWHDVETQHCFRRVQAHQFWSWQMALSPDGSRVATTTGQYLSGGWKYEPAPESEPSVKVYDTLSGDLVASLGHTPPVLSCAFSPDGQYLAAANMIGEVRVWDLHAIGDGQPLAKWTTPDFTSWGTTKSHHYTGGIYGLAFSPDVAALLGCGMGPMPDPMAGNGKMTWQRWDWRKGTLIDQIKEGQHGSGLMEVLAWHPDGQHFLMAGRQAQGTWNAALFTAADGSLATTLDTKSRITRARFTADGKTLITSNLVGHGKGKSNEWLDFGRVQVYRMEA